MVAATVPVCAAVAWLVTSALTVSAELVSAASLLSTTCASAMLSGW